MIKYSFLLILFFIIGYRAQGQHPASDSLTILLQNHSKDDTIKVTILNQLGNEYQWRDFCRSLKYAEQSLKLAQQLHFNKGIATANTIKGFCYWAFGDNDLAIEMGLEAAALAEKEHSATILTESYLILARGYLDQNENKKAGDYLNKAKKMSLQTKNWDQLSRVYNLAGVIQFVENNKDSALQLYNKALTIAQGHAILKINFPRIISNIGECYFKNNPDLGFDYFSRALLIAKETGNRTAEASISDIMGHAFLKKGNYQKTESYLQAALQLARELGLRRVIKHAYAGLVDLKLEQGKATEAVEYMKSYNEVRDSLLNTSKTRQIVELETKYEIEKKEQAIKLLEQEKHIQEIWRNILITGLILITALSIAIYYLHVYRENQNWKILNLQIDYLTSQNKELSDKYRDVLTNTNTNTNSIESVDQRLLKKTIDVIENNMSDPLFGVEQMAKELGMSRTNMHRKLKAITGFPPSELIRNIRLRKAATLLLSQADSVSQISFIVGFEDHSYFSKSFKKQFGVPPSEYLQSRENLNYS